MINKYFYHYNGHFEGKVSGQKMIMNLMFMLLVEGSEPDTFTNTKKLKISHTDFQRICNIIKHEGFSSEKEEYLDISHTSYNETKRIGKSMLTVFNSNYSSAESKNKVPMDDTAKDSRSLYSRACVIDVLLTEVAAAPYK